MADKEQLEKLKKQILELIKKERDEEKRKRYEKLLIGIEKRISTLEKREKKPPKEKELEAAIRFLEKKLVETKEPVEKAKLYSQIATLEAEKERLRTRTKNVMSGDSIIFVIIAIIIVIFILIFLLGFGGLRWVY